MIALNAKQWVCAEIAVLMAAGFAIGVFPARQKRLALLADIAARQGELQLAANAETPGGDLAEANAKLEQTLNAFHARLAPADAGHEVMAELWQIVEGSSLQAGTLHVTGEQKFNGYVSRDIAISLSGRFADFYGFLLRLSEGKSVWRVTRMHLARTPGADNEMTATLTVSVWLQAAKSAPVVVTDGR